MLRKGFVMRVNPDQHVEYKARHNPIWPELEDTLRVHGVHNYSIYLDAETDTLFGHVEIEDEARWAAIAETGICRKWWEYMSPIMPSNPDHSPVSKDLEEVFHMD